MLCPKCGNDMQEDALFCDQCGERVAVTSGAVAGNPPLDAPGSNVDGGFGKCPACGATHTAGEAFCGNCGGPLPLPEAASAVQPLAAAIASGAPSAGAALRCTACGADLEERDAFCYACGAAVASGKAVQVAPILQSATGAADGLRGRVPCTPADSNECPSCGARLTPGERYCAFCGLILERTPASPTAVSVERTAAIADTAAAASLRLDPDIEIPLPTGADVIVGRTDAYLGVYPDIDLTPFGAEEAGVSRRHFQIALRPGACTILDLNSTNYTLLNGVRLQPGVPVVLRTGDEIRAGRLRMVLVIT